MHIFSVAAKMTVQAGIGQSRASGLLQALAPPQAVLPLTAIPVCAFFASGGGDINSRAALMPTRPTGRDAFERRAPRKAGFMKLAEKSKRGPKCRIWEGSPTNVFQILSAGQNLKNTQVRPHLPCLPKRADSKIAVFENYVTLPPCILPSNMLK